MPFGSILRICSHQLLSLLFVLHHLFDGSRIADLLNLCVLALRFHLFRFGFRALLPRPLHQDTKEEVVIMCYHTCNTAASG